MLHHSIPSKVEKQLFRDFRHKFWTIKILQLLVLKPPNCLPPLFDTFVTVCGLPCPMLASAGHKKTLTGGMRHQFCTFEIVRARAHKRVKEGAASVKLGEGSELDQLCC